MPVVLAPVHFDRSPHEVPVRWAVCIRPFVTRDNVASGRAALPKRDIPEEVSRLMR
jgi:hypothetical protein